MAARFKPYNPDQSFLMPPSMREWLPGDHLAWFVSDVVDEMDLSEIIDPYRASRRGQPPYDPRMMAKLLMYAYSVGVPSSRKIEERTHTDVAFRVLAAGHHPDHDTICAFRTRHLAALSGLFVQVLLMCRRAGLVKLGHVALDGTKLKANASRHKAMSYARMEKSECELTEQVEALLREAAEADEAEDALYGKGRRAGELPEELRHRQSRLQVIREAKAALEEEARQKARSEGKLDEDDEPVPPKSGRTPKRPPGTPRAKDQRNFTDPESRIMKGPEGFVQGYNAQAAVDAGSQVIVAARVTQAANDKEQLEPALEQMEENLDKLPGALSADAGYWSENNARHLEQAGVEGYISPDRRRHTDREEPAPRGRIPKDASAADRMRRKLRTLRGRAQYGLRKQTVEPVFGQIKGARGMRSFLLRGLEKVQAEWLLIATTHNILKLWRSGWSPETASRAFASG